MPKELKKYRILIKINYLDDFICLRQILGLSESEVKFHLRQNHPCQNQAAA